MSERAILRLPGEYVITPEGEMMPLRTYEREALPRALAVKLVKLVGEEVALDHVRVSAHLIRAIEGDDFDEGSP